jgi:hypothetical protein
MFFYIIGSGRINNICDFLGTRSRVIEEKQFSDCLFRQFPLDPVDFYFPNPLSGAVGLGSSCRDVRDPFSFFYHRHTSHIPKGQQAASESFVWKQAPEKAGWSR